MFCPKCGCDFREGYFECIDCDVCLVNELPENFVRQEKNRSLVINLLLSLLTFIKNSISSKTFDQISYILFVFSCITLFLSDIFILRYNSLYLIDIGWEIPAKFVSPLKFTGSLSVILFLASFITGLLGIKCYIKQYFLNKLIYVFGFIFTISTAFLHLEKLPNNLINLYVHYWYLGILIFLPFLISMLYYNYKVKNSL